MELKLNVTINENKTIIQLADNQGTIEIIKGNTLAVEKPILYLAVHEGQINEIGNVAAGELTPKGECDQLLTISSTWEMELDYLTQLMIEEAKEAGIELATQERDEVKVPANARKATKAYLKIITTVLGTFGYPLTRKATTSAKKKPGKAQHRWNKEVSQIEFYVKSRESQATVIWQKRNEMLLKAGAKMKPQAELNKDGSVGFSAKMGEKIRFDHQGQFKDFVTTEDIILKSVNEIGLFLYFGGTNSWLELLDENGKSIDEYTVVK